MWVEKGITQSFLQETLNFKMSAWERRSSVVSQVLGVVEVAGDVSSVDCSRLWRNLEGLHNALLGETLKSKMASSYYCWRRHWDWDWRRHEEFIETGQDRTSCLFLMDF